MTRRPLAIAIIAGTVLAAAPATAAFAASGRSASGPAGLPADAPAALYRDAPTLPQARGWPGSNAGFSNTSGTGRLDAGGLYWTDWLYDDHGATTASTGGVSVTAGSPSFGLYTYPPGPADGNGADIFRAAVQLGAKASFWRVDWNTLASSKVPIAEWTFDRDDDASTGGAKWPAGAGVRSKGIDTALVMSSRGAELIRVRSGAVIRHLSVTVDKRAQSFVVRVPNTVLAPRGTWRIRLAAGLADARGTGFARPPDALPTQPAVYNVTFRHRTQENPHDNFWDDQAQTGALNGGNVSKFSHLLIWSRLRHHVTTPQPQPTGWSDRWYVSAVKVGNGILTSPATIADGKPNYLGRVQPYAVYVPTTYHHGRAAPLTFLLHSLTQDQNQYAATTPHFTQLACQDRHSICVTTLGRGPDGNYYDFAELDFWQVWHAVAAAYTLDPDRTIVSGYSMGGIGTNQLAMGHPDLFASAVTLAGAVGAVPSLHNLRWVPTYLAGGAEDELVPLTVERAEATALQALGDRFRWLLYPAIDHVVFELADGFADAARFMAHHSHRVVDPARFSYTWEPRNTEQAFSQRVSAGGGISWTHLPKYGITTTGDYWLRHLRARHAAANATVSAYSGERPDPRISTRVSQKVATHDEPEPGLATQLSWERHGSSPTRPLIRLRLTNVRALRVLVHAAGFAPGTSGRLRVTTDGRVRIRIGSRTIRLPKGTHTLQFDG